jgi:membrane protein required for colicin V production
MNIIDIVILIPIGLGFIFGLFKGLIKELMSLAAIIIGIYGAKFFAPALASVLIKLFNSHNSVIIPVAHLTVFLLIVGILMLLAHVFDKIISSISLGGLNRILGGVFGGLKYALLISFLINIVDIVDRQFHVIEKETKETSFIYGPMLAFGPVIWDEIQQLDIFDKNNQEKNAGGDHSSK